MNEFFEFLDVIDYEIELSPEEEEQTVVEFENDNFYILKYLLLYRTSLITMYGIKFTIEELFNQILKEGGTLDKLENGTEVAVANNYLNTPGIHGNTKIKNVSRHKVNKEKWIVKIPSKDPLILTGDHSIIVYRDGKLIECKAKEILPTDELIFKEK